MADALVVLSMVGVLGTASLVIVPAALDAAANGTGTPAAVTAREPAHQQTMDLLATLTSRSRAVLAVQPRGESPFVEMLLWMADEHDVGTINSDEVALIRHSAIGRVITFTSTSSEQPPGPALLPDTLDDRAFWRDWAVGPTARTRVIARRISDLVITSVAPPNGAFSLQIELSWATGSADRPDKAVAVVEARQARGPQE